MARFLSQILIRSSSTSRNPLKLGISHPNRFSSRSGNPRLLEIDLEASSSDSEVAFRRRFDDVIHNMIVKQSTPDWIPFVPGSSYWVPPIHHHETDGLYQVFKTLTHPLTFDEVMAVSSSSSSRGWASSAYFIQGTHPVHPVDVNADKNRENVFQSEDEEG